MATINIWQQFKSLIPEGARTVVTTTIIISNNGDGTSTATLRDGTAIRVQGESVAAGSKALVQDLSLSHKYSGKSELSFSEYFTALEPLKTLGYKFWSEI